MRLARVIAGGHPVPPAEIADEVELYARAHGRHARLHWFPVRFKDEEVIGTWVVRMTLRADDPRNLIMQEQRAPDEVTEDVWLHVSDGKGGYEALDIMQLGASGVRNFLERGNTWSGRGQFASVEEAVRRSNEQNVAARAKAHADARNSARDRARDLRRQVLGIPLVRVLRDIVPKLRRS